MTSFDLALGWIFVKILVLSGKLGDLQWYAINFALVTSANKFGENKDCFHPCLFGYEQDISKR